MPFVRLQCEIPATTALPEDAIQMVTHWIGPVGDETALETAQAAVTNFEAFLTAVGSYFSTSYQSHRAYYKAFDLLDPKPRIPIWTFTSARSAPAAPENNLPAEVALVVSFQGEPEAGVNQRRRRGRFYLGPIGLTLGSGGDADRIPTAVVDAVATAAWNNLVIPSPSDAVLAVYSSYTAKSIPVGGTPGPGDDEDPELIPGACTQVLQLWVDNAWDTQRRRGLTATYRKQFA